MPRHRTNVSLVVVGELHSNVKYICPFKIAPLKSNSSLNVSAYVHSKVTFYLLAPLHLDNHPVLSKLPR